MNGSRARKTFTLAAAGLACLLLLAPAARAAKGLKKSDAQKLIAALSLLELNKGAVTIREINSTESAATVLAGVRTAFRFARDERGAWRAVEARVGDRQWEDFELLARAAGAERIAVARSALDALAAELDALARARKSETKAAEAKGEREEAAEAGGDGREKKGKGGREERSAEEIAETPLVRGALRVEKPAAALSALGSSAVLEAELDASFEFVKDGGKWRVASARLAGESLGDFDALARALDQAKAARAREDLAALASALEAYRRERGFYVVADTVSALNDHLNPRYLNRLVRFDPWHRSYEYEGTRDRFSLNSAGPDGKPKTADDVTVRK